MDSIDHILKSKKVEAVQKPKPVQQWQDLAAQIYEELKAVDTEKSSIFKICRENYAGAYAAYKECKERGKNILYWFAIMNKKKAAN